MTKSTRQTCLVTGAAGFIGMHTSIELLRRGYEVIGIDSLIPYYDPRLKQQRIEQIHSVAPLETFRFFEADLTQLQKDDFREKIGKPSFVVHLAAQAGVRHSIENPMAYAHSNLVGMTSLLEFVRWAKPLHSLYASSSSVYGGNTSIPFRETDRVDNPVSFYAATKRSNEAMAASYSNMFKIRLTGLRFFTVYGPWGRPDMAPWLFTDAAFNGTSIKVFGGGLLKRDFTYIDDIVTGIIALLESKDQIENHSVFNIGNNQPNTVNELIDAIETSCQRRIQKTFEPIPIGDVSITCADIEKIKSLTGFSPKTNLFDGIRSFVAWYRGFHSY